MPLSLHCKRSRSAGPWRSHSDRSRGAYAVRPGQFATRFSPSTSRPERPEWKSVPRRDPQRGGYRHLPDRAAPAFFPAQGKRSGSPTPVTLHPVEIVPYAANLSAGFSGKGQESVRRAAAFCKRPKKRICRQSAKRQIPQGLGVSCIRPGRLAAVSSPRAHSSKQKGTRVSYGLRPRGTERRKSSSSPGSG